METPTKMGFGSLLCCGKGSDRYAFAESSVVLADRLLLLSFSSLVIFFGSLICGALFCLVSGKMQ